MELFGEGIAWLADPANWTHPRNGIFLRLWEHVSLSAVAFAVAAAIALPIGLVIGHTGRGAAAVIAVANIGRAVPSVGWLGIVFAPLLLLLRARWPRLRAIGDRADPPGHSADRHQHLCRHAGGRPGPGGGGAGHGHARVTDRASGRDPGCAAGDPGRRPLIGGPGRRDRHAGHDRRRRDARVPSSSRASTCGRSIGWSGAAILVSLLAIITELGFAWLQRRAISPGLRAQASWAPRDAAEVAIPAD